MGKERRSEEERREETIEKERDIERVRVRKKLNGKQKGVVERERNRRESERIRDKVTNREIERERK